jgi:hypothetical protein
MDSHFDRCLLSLTIAEKQILLLIMLIFNDISVFENKLIVTKHR